MANTNEMSIKVTFPEEISPLSEGEKEEIIRQLKATQISKIILDKQGEVKLEAQMKPEIQWDIDQ